MIQRLTETLLKRSVEVGLAVGLVTTSYLAILAILTFAFPQGTSLRALLRERGASAATLDSVRELRLGGAARQAEVATLSRKSHKVKDKSSASIAWRDSEEGMKLGERHSVQTFDRSFATISFDRDNRIDLGENSLVVLKSFDREEDGSDRRASLLVLGGEVRAAVGGRTGTTPLDLEMETAHGTARIRSKTDAKVPVEFRVQVDETRSTSRISLIRGEVEISTGGATVPLLANQAVELEPGGAPMAPIELPKPPRLRDAAERTFSYRTQPPLVRFAWDAVPGAEGYVLVIAKDAGFREVVYRAESRTTEVEYGNLLAGRYLWHVSTVANGLEGAPSASGRLVLRSDTAPPRLSVAWPEGAIRGPEVVIEGRTEPDMHIFVANQPAPVDAEGSFARTIALERGANVIVVEAVDPVGNTAYESHVVNAEY